MTFATSNSSSALDPPADGTEHETAGGMSPMLLTFNQAAALLAIGRTSLYELVWSGRLASVHIGRSVRIRASELERFVDGLSSA